MPHKLIFLPDAHELAHVFTQVASVEGERRIEIFRNLAIKVIEHSNEIHRMFEMGLTDE